MAVAAPSPVYLQGMPVGWNVQANGNEALTGNSPDSSFSPALTASGFLTESIDFNVASGTFQPAVKGTLYGSLTSITEYDTLVTNLDYVVTTAGTGLTALQNFVVLISQATGAVAGISADQSTLWQTAGPFVTPIVVPISVAKGGYYVAFVGNTAAGTLPTFAAGPVNSAVITNWNTTAAAGNLNACVIAAGLTTAASINAAAPFTLTGLTPLAQRIAVGLS